ncbi:hypothetical protein GXC69_10900 [Candidatus Macondimonas diazotrophica]|nr:hypothetical protein [Candidatus Macondimonas diazotrophica]
MANNPESLLLRLNLASPGVIAGAPGHGALSRADIAAVLGMGSPPQHLVWLAEVRYLADSANLGRLAKEAWWSFARLGHQRGWDKRDYERGAQLFRACAVVAVLEVLTEDLRLCLTCDGRGEKRRLQGGRQVMTTCPRCHGRRPVELTDATRLEYLNAALATIGHTMADSTWYATWRYRYYHAVILLRGWGDELLRHVRRHAGAAA